MIEYLQTQLLGKSAHRTTTKAWQIRKRRFAFACGTWPKHGSSTVIAVCISYCNVRAGR